jgi:hypothetical protein
MPLIAVKPLRTGAGEVLRFVPSESKRGAACVGDV